MTTATRCPKCGRGTMTGPTYCTGEGLGHLFGCEHGWYTEHLVLVCSVCLYKRFEHVVSKEG